MLKVKERIFKAAREKQRVTYKGVPIRLSADFSKDILQARRDWQEVFKVIKSKDLQQSKLLYPAKLSFRIEVLHRQGKTKEVHHHQAIIIWNAKGSYIRKRSKWWTLKWQ